MEKQQAISFDETQRCIFASKNFTPCHRDNDGGCSLINNKLWAKVKKQIELIIARVDILDDDGDIWDYESGIYYVVSETWLHKYYNKFIKCSGKYDNFTNFTNTYYIDEIGLAMFEQAKTDNAIVEYIGIRDID